MKTKHREVAKPGSRSTPRRTAVAVEERKEQEVKTVPTARLDEKSVKPAAQASTAAAAHQAAAPVATARSEMVTSPSIGAALRDIRAASRGPGLIGKRGFLALLIAAGTVIGGGSWYANQGEDVAMRASVVRVQTQDAPSTQPVKAISQPAVAAAPQVPAAAPAEKAAPAERPAQRASAAPEQPAKKKSTMRKKAAKSYAKAKPHRADRTRTKALADGGRKGQQKKSGKPHGARHSDQKVVAANQY